MPSSLRSKVHAGSVNRSAVSVAAIGSSQSGIAIAVEADRLLRVRLDERDVAVHPALEELLGAVVGQGARGVEEAFLDGEEHLGLAERRHVEVSEDGTEVLLRAGGADGADRDAEDAGRLAAPGALPVGT